MYWVVLRYGVKDWAVMLLRNVAFEYIGRCNLKTEIWNELFNPSAPFNHLFPNALQYRSQPLIVRADDNLMETINAHLTREVFDQVMTGGPFGKDAQIHVAMSYPGPTFLLGKETFEDAVRRRQALWDKGYPWSEGLAKMFDAAQEELFFQLNVIGEDARRAEARFIKLSPLQQVAHKHLVSVRSGDVVDQNTGSDRWLPLLRELDPEEFHSIVSSKEKRGEF
jgi:hypothetical protein